MSVGTSEGCRFSRGPDSADREGAVGSKTRWSGVVQVVRRSLFHSVPDSVGYVIVAAARNPLTLASERGRA
eukprot:5308530-Alexandrium_andersonii.AAC.1